MRSIAAHAFRRAAMVTATAESKVTGRAGFARKLSATIQQAQVERQRDRNGAARAKPAVESAAALARREPRRL
jgi:hypothetical protein